MLVLPAPRNPVITVAGFEWSWSNVHCRARGARSNRRGTAAKQSVWILMTGANRSSSVARYQTILQGSRQVAHAPGAPDDGSRSPGGALVRPTAES